MRFLSPCDKGFIKTPLFLNRIPAGDPSEKDSQFEYSSLDEIVAESCSESILYIIVEGESMRDAGIYNGDVLIIDRLRQPRNGDEVFVRINSGYTVKKWRDDGNISPKRKLRLVPANDQYKEIPITSQDDFEVIGLVTYSLHKRRNRK